MEFKPLDKTNELEQLQALNERLILNHPKIEEVLADFKMKTAEVKGEREVAYPLKYLNKREYLFLHNLRLEDENGYFQIDTLLLHPNYTLILEVKNWKGTIIFGDNGQVTRKLDGEEEGFPNPVSQVKLQQHRLTKWLLKHGFYNIKIHFLIVISFPSTIIKSSPTVSIPPEVTHNSELYFKISALEEKYNSKITDMDALMKTATLLKEAHTPPTRHLLEKYKLTSDDLITGVFCPNCNRVPMERFKKKWHCPACGCYSAEAHLASLNDYKLLVNEVISNKEARNFLRLESSYVVKRLLKKANVQFNGNTKSRKYRL